MHGVDNACAGLHSSHRCQSSRNLSVLIQPDPALDSVSGYCSCPEIHPTSHECQASSLRSSLQASASPRRSIWKLRECKYKFDQLTTFSVSWILRRAEGEGKFVSLDKLRLLSLVNTKLSMRKNWEIILKDAEVNEENTVDIYLDMVLLAEEKPEEEEVRLPSPGLGIILIFCNIP